MSAVKLFFDTEFTGLHQETSLISIGIVSENGNSFYAELNDFDEKQIDSWLEKHVIKNLKFNSSERFCRKFNEDKDGYSVELKCDFLELKIQLMDWFSQFDYVEFWSDCLSYDWMLFCQIFGGSLNLPSFIYYIPFDICTYFKVKGINPDINREFFANLEELALEKHNALFDAKVIFECFKKLSKS